MKKSALGFTLIELLVVITIIAILSVLGLVVYGGIQKSARMARRAQDLEAVRTALEVYYAKNGSYPLTSTTIGAARWRSECVSWGSYLPGAIFPLLTPKYLIAMPKDPSMDAANDKACYLYTSDGIDYKFLDYQVPASEMTSADFRTQNNLIDTWRDGGSDNSIVDGTNVTAWSVYSPGAVLW